MAELSLQQALDKARNAPGTIRVFCMVRQADANKTSGTGRVLDGVVFANGKTVASWRSTAPNARDSIVVYDTYEDFKAIHIDSHPENGTEILWLAELK